MRHYINIRDLGRNFIHTTWQYTSDLAEPCGTGVIRMHRLYRDQARIQVFGLEGAKFGEGSGDLGGPQSGPGRSPGGGTRGGGAMPPGSSCNLEILGSKIKNLAFFMSKLPSPIATM